MNNKIKTFTDLLVWKEGHKLVLEIYKVTKDFPRDEIFGLVSQMRRCSISITSNVAEGFGRKGYKEKIQFYYLAQGSMTELKNQLLIARDVGYLNENIFNKIAEISNNTHALLQGLIKKSKTFLNLNS
ncbi:four helix bundle protein [Candidatus Parcubacteria bacterium]|nr:four helix bundle protein [Candidatus Parcubacteria bacterium]